MTFCDIIVAEIITISLMNALLVKGTTNILLVEIAEKLLEIDEK